MDPEQLKQLQAQFQQISGDLASGDPAKVKAGQTKLQALGFDVGTPDGVLGGKTSAAVGELRKTIQTAESNIATTSTADAEKAKNDPVNRITKMGTEVAPYLGGAGVGYGMSRAMKKGFDARDAQQKIDVNRLTKAMDVDPRAAQSELNRMNRGRVGRSMGQFAVPGGFLGASEATRQFIAPQFEDPGTREAINLLATGEQAAGVTMGAKQLYDLATRGNPNDPVDVAKIRSRTMPPAPSAIPRPAEISPALQDAKAAAPAAEEIKHSERLKIAAKAVSGKVGKNKRHRTDLIKKGLNEKNMPDVAEALKLPRDADRRTILQRLREVSSIGGKMAIPLAVGSYMAATGDSEAADATTGERAANAAGNFAAGAGGAYAGSKAMDALAKAAPTAMRALGAGASMAMPSAAADMTDWSQEDINMGRNTAARTLPESLQFGAIDEAREMATVPERNPERSPYPSKLITRVQRMKKQGASPDQIADWLNKAMP